MRTHLRLRLASLVFAATAAFPAGAQSTSTAPQPLPCGRTEYRQFDFWLGEWEVKGPQGKVVGRSSITSILGGCVIKEAYSVVGGPYRGESYNTWDARTGQWHQSWVDNGGLLALFDGGLRSGAMVLEGAGADTSGTFRSRMTFTPLPDGRVRQHWERSYNQGGTWSTLFDGYYNRTAGKP